MTLQDEDERDTIRRVPTISRVAGDTIVELVYDGDRRRTGLVVSRFGGLWNIEQEVRVGSDELLVPYSASNNLIESGCILLPSRPEPHGDKAELLAQLEAYIARYVDLSPTFTRIAAHYVLLSWVNDAFNELPYLRLQGEFGTGKTRGLLAIGSVCYKPFFASGASTVSPIFHILDTVGGTLVLDEADFRFSDATNDLVKILNNGTMSGLPVLRTMQNRNRELHPRAFRVFGPKLVAMRGRYDDRGLESRFITEPMGRRPLRNDIPIHLPAELRTEALELRNKLLHFRLTALASTEINPSVASDAATPRLNQMMLPLLSLVDEPAVRTAIAMAVVNQVANSPRPRAEEWGADILAILLERFSQADVMSVSIGEIARRLNARNDRAAALSSKWVGWIVREELGLETHKSNGVYVLSRGQLPEIEALAARIRGVMHGGS